MMSLTGDWSVCLVNDSLNVEHSARAVILSLQQVCCRQFYISTVQGEFTKLNTHVLLSAYSYTIMHAP